MSDKERRIGYGREFLNEPYMTSTSSCISYNIKVRSWYKKLQEEGLFDSAAIEFSISDCGKNIHLDFEIHDKENMRNSLFKLDTIINTCQAMKEDLKKARLEVLKGKKRVETLTDEEKRN